MSRITKTEFLEAQVKNAQFKLEIQQKTNEKMKEIVAVSAECTNLIRSFFEDGKILKGFDVMTDMNQYVEQETENLEKCAKISSKHHETLWHTMQHLTSKDNEKGDPQTPEMNIFKRVFNTHCQMLAHQDVKHLNKFYETYNKTKTNIND